MNVEENACEKTNGLTLKHEPEVKSRVVEEKRVRRGKVQSQTEPEKQTVEEKMSIVRPTIKENSKLEKKGEGEGEGKSTHQKKALKGPLRFQPEQKLIQ